MRLESLQFVKWLKCCSVSFLDAWCTGQNHMFGIALPMRFRNLIMKLMAAGTLSEEPAKKGLQREYGHLLGTSTSV